MADTNNDAKLTIERLDEITNDLEFQLRFSAMTHSTAIYISADNAAWLYALAKEASRVLKEKEKPNV